jgi:hypothetical protein
MLQVQCVDEEECWNLADGEYNEQGARESFQQAVMEWRGNSTCKRGITDDIR